MFQINHYTIYEFLQNDINQSNLQFSLDFTNFFPSFISR